MKIEVAPNTERVQFQSLKEGDVFLDDGAYYMVVDHVTEKDTEDDYNVVDLEDGTLTYRSADEYVTRVVAILKIHKV